MKTLDDSAWLDDSVSVPAWLRRSAGTCQADLAKEELMDGLWMVYGWLMDDLWMVYGWLMVG